MGSVVVACRGLWCRAGSTACAQSVCVASGTNRFQTGCVPSQLRNGRGYACDFTSPSRQWPSNARGVTNFPF
jgi:hypothetical protein